MKPPTEWALWGPQFALEVLPQLPDAGSDWAPLPSLVDDPSVLDARIAQTSTALARMGGAATVGSVEVEPRVAASLAQMALVGRITAAGMGLAVLGRDAGPLLDGRGWWQSVPGPAFPLALVEEPAASTDPAGPTLGGTWIERLATVMAERHRVPSRTLWGNVASVVQATRGIIIRTTPHLAGRADAVAARLLEHPRIDPAERLPASPFRRHSCCLLYRMTPDRTPVCGDCVLIAPDAA